eukprot:Seg315.3 transcript_id=Seg315.3/GoldUCD/mRNA.D3Y31 product="hypothetical protein" protein_id=Seg315.3/GoldUCD/D3Y31
MAAKNGSNERLLSIAWIFLVLAKHSLVNCGVCDVNDGMRTYCGWHGLSGTLCRSIGCCWKQAAIPGIPWCFYDSGIAANLRSTKVCEHTGPAILTCNSTQQIKIHDVFYGRNADDNRCHNGGSITCFNPNATQIGKNICKTNSTCMVPSIGAIWNFNPTCDGLNAQLRIHYMCIARETNSSSRRIPVPSTSIRVSPSQSISKTTSLPQSQSQHISIPVSSSSKYNYQTVASNSMMIMSTKIARSSIIVATVSKTKMPQQSPTCSPKHEATPDDGKFGMKIKKKDRIILGLSIVIAAMSIVITFLIFLKICKKQSTERKIKGSEDPGLHYNNLKAKNDKTLANADFELENENPYYESASCAS